MINDPRFMSIGEEFWREYAEPLNDHVEWIVRRSKWEALLAGVFEAGFNEGSSGEGDDQ